MNKMYFAFRFFCHQTGKSDQFVIEFLSLDNDGDIASCPNSWGRFACICRLFGFRAP